LPLNVAIEVTRPVAFRTSDRTAFRAVAVEQILGADPVNNEREFPCKVARVLHTRVHSLAARRTVNVGRISSEEDPPGAVVRHLAFVDAKRGEPNRVGRADSTGKALVENGLHLLKGRLRRRN
jgi:hypothetical protein